MGLGKVGPLTFEEEGAALATTGPGDRAVLQLLLYKSWHVAAERGGAHGKKRMAAAHGKGFSFQCEH